MKKIRPPHELVFCALAIGCNAANDESHENTASNAPGSEGTTSVSAPVPSASGRTVVPGLPSPLTTRVEGLAMVDRVDVANEASEREHAYAVTDPTFLGTQEFDIAAANVAYTEDGRATKSSEAFVIKVVPNQENLLIRAFDTFAKEQKVRVSLDGKAAGEWALPDNESSRYGEAVFPLSASMVGNRVRLNVKMDYVSGVPDINSFVYWVYAKPDRKLETPLGTNIAGLALTDSVDVANEADEAEHRYVIDQATYVGTQQFEWPANGLPFFEDGRANKSFESFRMKTTPNKDHVLVKAYDTFSKNQAMRVLVNGSVVGEWSLPDAEKRYNESSFRIPARFIGTSESIDLRIEFLSGADANSFYYWLFADSKNG